MYIYICIYSKKFINQCSQGRKKWKTQVRSELLVRRYVRGNRVADILRRRYLDLWTNNESIQRHTEYSGVIFINIYQE